MATDSFQSPAGPTHSRRAKIIVWTCWALALAHLIANRICWASIPMQADVGIWSYIAWRMGQGAKLYVDLWDQKPPGIYLSLYFVQWLTGEAATNALLWLDAIITLAVLLVTYRACRFFAGAAASSLSIVLLAIVFGHRVLADWGCNTEKFVAFFEMMAMCLVLKALRKNAKKNFLLAGVCSGAASFFKQTGLLLMLCVLAVLFFSNAMRGRRRVAGWMALGFTCFWSPAIAIMGWYKVLPDFCRDVLFYDISRLATSSNAAESTQLLALRHWSMALESLKSSLILFGPACIGLIQIIRTPPNDRDELRVEAVGLRIVVLQWLLCIGVFVIAPHGYGHFLLQAAPSAAILTAWAGESLRNSRTSWKAAYALTLVLGLVLLSDHFRFTFDSKYLYRQAYATRRMEQSELIAAIRSYSHDNESVMIWPPDDAASYLARRRTPLEISNAIIGLHDRIELLRPNPAELVERMRKDPPALIIDTTALQVVPTPSPIEPHGSLKVEAGLSLWEEPMENHPKREGRVLFPLKTWIRRHYGGQELIPGVGTVFRFSRPWREWWDVLTKPTR